MDAFGLRGKEENKQGRVLVLVRDTWARGAQPVSRGPALPFLFAFLSICTIPLRRLKGPIPLGEDPFRAASFRLATV